MKRAIKTIMILVLCACFVLALWACDQLPEGTQDGNQDQSADGTQNGSQDQSADGTQNGSQTGNDAQTVSAKTMSETYVTAAQDVPTITDYHVAEGFDIGKIRFTFYSPETGWTEDIEHAPFDPSKPTVIHSHGQGSDGRMFTPETYYREGYNVISFLWGALSDEMDVLSIDRRVWQSITSYCTSKDVVVAAEGFDCTVPELFVARYCDFFARYPDYNMPIRLTGHSFGGQLTFALASYMTKLFSENRLPARLYPERFTLLDPYFDNAKQDFDCPWLGVKTQFSSLGIALYCMNNILLPNNVPIEMLRTSTGVEIACIMGIAYDDDPNYPDYWSEFKPYFRVVELANPDDLRAQFDDVIEASGFLHTIANDFYFSPNALSIYTDQNGVEIFGRANSASLMLATRAMHFNLYVDKEDYHHYENVTVERTIDKKYRDTTVVAGLVAFDANANGLFDDLAADRLTDVTVVLKDNATGETQTASTVNGYYCFNVTRNAAYTLTVSAANYQAQSVTVNASAFVNLADFALAKK